MAASRGARAEGWSPEAGAPRGEASGVHLEVALRGELAAGLVPHFRSGDRDRIAGGPEVLAWFGDRVRLGLTGEYLRDSTEAGGEVAGFGDLRLSSGLRLWTAGPVHLGIGWEAKMPNASDAGELGTDETDILFGGWGSGEVGDFAFAASVGLGVLGNPLRFAGQDDVPLLAASAAWIPSRWRLQVGASAELATSRNPARVELLGSVRHGGPWFVELGGTAGLTPAAANGSAEIRFGWAAPLPIAAARE